MIPTASSPAPKDRVLRGEEDQSMFHIYVYTDAHMYEDTIMKPIKYCLKKKGRRLSEYNTMRGGELIQSTPHTCMELSQWNLLCY
jgi:hypothetical protein